MGLQKGVVVYGSPKRIGVRERPFGSATLALLVFSGTQTPHSSSVPRSLPLPHQHCSIARCVVKIEEENHMQVSEELHVAKEAAGWNAAL